MNSRAVNGRITGQVPEVDVPNGTLGIVCCTVEGTARMAIIPSVYPALGGAT